ncbi:hypothetical protein CYMTET_15990 [Cymbomonas tetramitiformis]|uniref:Uncharacterized protein n=1 Tax=Cymbomonas tetramitiformis TaxID=36881 RepID=A0AAE0GD02_9CHLO|nr:hypothetical protein CYMTET_15990 [Cymbomonas tetramitiformis]
MQVERARDEAVVKMMQVERARDEAVVKMMQVERARDEAVVKLMQVERARDEGGLGWGLSNQRGCFEGLVGLGCVQSKRGMDHISTPRDTGRQRTETEWDYWSGSMEDNGEALGESASLAGGEKPNNEPKSDAIDMAILPWFQHTEEDDEELPAENAAEGPPRRAPSTGSLDTELATPGQSVDAGCASEPVAADGDLGRQRAEASSRWAKMMWRVATRLAVAQKRQWKQLAGTEQVWSEAVRMAVWLEEAKEMCTVSRNSEVEHQLEIEALKATLTEVNEANAKLQAELHEMKAVVAQQNALLYPNNEIDSGAETPQLPFDPVLGPGDFHLQQAMLWHARMAQEEHGRRMIADREVIGLKRELATVRGTLLAKHPLDTQERRLRLPVFHKQISSSRQLGEVIVGSMDTVDDVKKIIIDELPVQGDFLLAVDGTIFVESQGRLMMRDLLIARGGHVLVVYTLDE